jgi:predicted FMN-binding regulatory protein PaiB
MYTGDHAWYTYGRLRVVHISTVNDSIRNPSAKCLALALQRKSNVGTIRTSSSKKIRIGFHIPFLIQEMGSLKRVIEPEVQRKNNSLHDVPVDMPEDG